MNASLPVRLARRPRWWLVSAFVVIAVGVGVGIATALGSGTAAPTTNSAVPPAKGCPSASLVASTLNQTIRRSSAVALAFGGGASRELRLTCSYRTSHGTTIEYQLTSNVNPYAIAAAEAAGFGTDVTFSGGAGFEHAKHKSVVIPAFAQGLMAWTLKQGRLLDAEYGKTNLFIDAPNATPSEMEALAKDTQGIPQPNLKVSAGA